MKIEADERDLLESSPSSVQCSILVDVVLATSARTHSSVVARRLT